MIVLTELGYTYIKDDFIYVKKSGKYIHKYLGFIRDIVKIEKDYIKFKKNNNIKIRINRLNINNIGNNAEFKILRESDLAITNISVGSDRISGAMKVEDNRIRINELLRFESSFTDVMDLPQKFLINKIRVHQDINRIYIKYNIEDAELLYYLINSGSDDYLYEKDAIEIMIGDEIIDWDGIKTVRIEYIFKKIIENNRASIRLIEEPLIKNKYNIKNDYCSFLSFTTCIKFYKHERFFEDEYEKISRGCDDNGEIAEFEKKRYRNKKKKSI